MSQPSARWILTILSVFLQWCTHPPIYLSTTPDLSPGVSQSSDPIPLIHSPFTLTHPFIRYLINIRYGFVGTMTKRRKKRAVLVAKRIKSWCRCDLTFPVLSPCRLNHPRAWSDSLVCQPHFQIISTWRTFCGSTRTKGCFSSMGVSVPSRSARPSSG